MHLFDTLASRCSRLTTHLYSTSFSLGIRCLHERLRDPIYAIYGFVRLADEIVDNNESMVGSIEIIDDDLESGSREIANLFNESLDRTEAQL